MPALLRRAALASLLLTAALALPRVARADEPPDESAVAPPPEPEPPAPVAAPPVMLRQPEEKPRKHWYGWETLMTDGISFATMPVIVGFGGYFVAVPIVHLAHGRAGAALGSLALRVGAPIAMAFTLGGLEVALAHERGSYAGIVGAFAGLIVGISAAIAIDASVLAYEPAVDDPQPKPPKSARSTLTLMPIAAPRGSGGVDLGLGGTF